MADSDEVDPCPSRGVASDEREITVTSPRVRAWSRGECGTEWAFTVGNPAQRYLDHLTACVDSRRHARRCGRSSLWLITRRCSPGSGCGVGCSRWPGARPSGPSLPEVPDRPLVERGPRLGSRRPVGPGPPETPAGYRSNPRVPGSQPVPPPAPDAHNAKYADLARRVAKDERSA
jgi:hypothetical protein